MMSLSEIARCDIGNCVVSICADSFAQEKLLEFPLVLQDFITDRPAELTFCVQRLEIATDLQDHFSPEGKSICPLGTPERRRRLEEAICQHPGIMSCLDYTGFGRDADLCIPLKTGVLVAAGSQSKAFLFLYPPAHEEKEEGFYFASTLNALMALLSFYISNAGGALVHGTGLHLDGQGFLFVSPSGGGKTTLSRNAAPGTVLADDGVIVRRVADGIEIFPTPFRQRTGGGLMRRAWCRRSVPLQALLFLEKGPKTSVLPVSRPEALARLSNTDTHFAAWFPRKTRLQLFDFWRHCSVILPILRFQWEKGTGFSSLLTVFTEN